MNKYKRLFKSYRMVLLLTMHLPGGKIHDMEIICNKYIKEC